MSSTSVYKRLDQRQHVLLRPGMYIGSVAPTATEAWVYEDGALCYREVTVAPAFAQVFLEILTNATDHAIRTAGHAKAADRVTRIAVALDPATGVITVENNGRGIETGAHPEYGVPVPELIFGSLLTSSNFEDEARTVAGQNGIGAKSTNIFSARFTVSTYDAAAKTAYTQTWRDNMSIKEPPALVPRAPRSTLGAFTTRVEYLPDYARFGMKGLDADALALAAKCALDACAVTPPGVQVRLDGADLGVKNFKQYVAMYVADFALETFATGADPSGAWEIAVAVSPDGLRQVSFVNGLCTPKGGKHVEHVAAAVCRKLVARLSSKRAAVKTAAVRNALWLFVKAVVPNPSFDSQNKHTLTSPVGVRYEPSEAFLKAIIAKTGIAERVTALTAADDESKLKKTDGAQRSTVSGIPKLDDANWAGTKRSRACTLILTEGDSAKSTAIAGLAVTGRDRFGVFPLRGKVLNVRDSSVAKIGENEEIKAIKRIMGLESGRDYPDEAARCDLRYGSVMLLADQDTDGFHIKGLILNLFHTLWPRLARQPGFLTSMLTPIVKARRAAGAETLSFYSMPAFEAWRGAAQRQQQQPQQQADDAHCVQRPLKGWSVKYYKGLGTSTSADAKEYFRDMKVVEYECSSSLAAGASVPPKGKRLMGGGASDKLVKPAKRSKPNQEPAELTNEEQAVIGSQDDALVRVRLRVVASLASPSEERVVLEILRDDADALDMAFRKNRAEERKRWLDNMDKHAHIDYDVMYPGDRTRANNSDETSSVAGSASKSGNKTLKAAKAPRGVKGAKDQPATAEAVPNPRVSLTDFVNRELGLFSWDDVSRSLPSAIDGLKRSQRKVLYGAKKSMAAGEGETRVAQLAAYVSQVSAYHHGEASLQQTIVGMAQGFVGSGHVQLLTAAGQFGSRIMGGKDAASARYIHTQVSRHAIDLFPAHDEAVLERNLDDDYKPVEPLHYLPVLPLALLNGALGIGTGYSTNVPCFDPALVLEAYRQRLLDAGGPEARRLWAALEDPPPCYRGFKGTVEKAGGRWHTAGCFALHATHVDVTELPVGVWTADYKQFLEELCADPKSGYKRYESHYTEDDARFTVFFDAPATVTVDQERRAKIAADLRLRSDKGQSVTNMHLLDEDERVRRFSTPREIAELHFKHRHAGYAKRIAHMTAKAEQELAVTAAKVDFVRQVIRKDIDLTAFDDALFAEHAARHGWPPVSGKHDYLYNMPMSSLTNERFARLEAERARCADALETLRRLTPEAAWLADLERLSF